MEQINHDVRNPEIGFILFSAFEEIVYLLDANSGNNVGCYVSALVTLSKILPEPKNLNEKKSMNSLDETAYTFDQMMSQLSSSKEDEASADNMESENSKTISHTDSKQNQLGIVYTRTTFINGVTDYIIT